MKKLALILLFMPALAMAQIKSGKIVFEEKVNVEMDLEGEGIPDDPEMAEMIKKLHDQASRSKKVLIFNQEETLYRDFDAKADGSASWTSDDGNQELQIMVMRPTAQVYRNLTENKLTEQQDLWGKKFIIDEKPEKRKWKITGEQAMMAGYQCQQAVYEKDSTKILVWFTPQIPVSAGPQNYGGLPGMILRMDVNDGELIIEAKSISEEAEEIEKPKGGKKVSREEFIKIRESKIKEMQEMSGGGKRIEIDID
mgnify:CR=1 FL=1